MQEAPLYYKTISQVASLIEAKDLSPVELTESMLARIDAVDGQYLSYATVMADQAMESARAAETAISAGNYLGPLHGVPIAVKDLCFPKGVRTMGGAKGLRDPVPDFDATLGGGRQERHATGDARGETRLATPVGRGGDAGVGGAASAGRCCAVGRSQEDHADARHA